MHGFQTLLAPYWLLLRLEFAGCSFLIFRARRSTLVVVRILQSVDGRILCADRLFLVSVPMRGRGSECVWFEGAMCRFW